MKIYREVELFLRDIGSIRKSHILIGIFFFIIEVLLMFYMNADKRADNINYSTKIFIDASILTLTVVVLLILLHRKNKEFIDSWKRYKLIFNNSSDIIFFIETDGRIVDANKAAEETYGYSRNEFTNLKIVDLCAFNFDEMILSIRNGELYETEHIRRDGTLFPVEVSSKTIILKNETKILVNIRDVTLRKNHEELITKSRDFYLTLLNEFPALIWRSNINGCHDYFNKTWLNFTGLQFNQAIANGWKQIVHPDELAQFWNNYISHFSMRKPFEVEYRMRRFDGVYRWMIDNGSPYFNEHGIFAGYIGVCHDITERKLAEEQIRYYAYHDYLTGLPNLRKLHEYLNESIAAQNNINDILIVYFIDLDDFKKVNDTLGHDKGDDLVKCISQRLLEVVENDGILARVGGDEFAIVIPNISDRNKIDYFAKKILSVFKKSYIIGNNEFYISTSVGVAIYPDNSSDVKSILKNADTAMFEAKENGKNNYLIYHDDMSNKISKRIELENKLKMAINNDELNVYYQPQIEISTGKMIGIEALLRWITPNGEIISPNDFIPTAEETGLIIPIGEWVIGTVCRQIKVWENKGYKPVRISVNISPRQLQEPDIVNLIVKHLEDVKLNPELLGIEITESLAMNNTYENFKTLSKLKDIGIYISIDDFGTRYSSLSYINNFPVDEIKIDRAFINDITYKHESAAIAEAFITLANSLNYKIVAEGVETVEQAEMLVNLGCNVAQGFLYNKPATPSEIESKFLKNK